MEEIEEIIPCVNSCDDCVDIDCDDCDNFEGFTAYDKCDMCGKTRWVYGHEFNDKTKNLCVDCNELIEFLIDQGLYVSIDWELCKDMGFALQKYWTKFEEE